MKISPQKLFYAPLVIFALLVSSISFSQALPKTFTLDEVEEAEWAQRLPVEGAKIFFDPEGVQGYGVTHPLLYTYLLSFVYKIAGSSEIALRSFGLLCYLASLALMLLIIKELFSVRQDLMKHIMAIACIFYLINPLLIQHSLLLNADNNISALLLLLFIFLFIKSETYTGGMFLISRIALSVCFAGNFMAKEITPIFLITGIILFRLINRQWRRLIADVAITGIIGILIFWLLWSVYCFFTGIDIMSFLNYTLIGKSKKITMAFLLKSLMSFFYYWRWPWYWVSAPFFILVFMFICSRIRLFLRVRRLENIDIVMLCALAMWIPYHFVKASVDMMKYQYPAYPLFIICIAYLTARAFFELKNNNAFDSVNVNSIILMIHMIAAVLLFYYWLLGDYINQLWQPLYHYMNQIFLPLYYLPIVFTSAAAFIFFRNQRLFQKTAIGLTILTVPVSGALDLRQSAASYTTAECWLNYGESGLAQTAEYLSERVDGNSIVAIRKDIAYYLKYKYGVIPAKIFTPRHIHYTLDRRVLEALMRTVDMQYMVMDKVSGIPVTNKYLMGLIKEYYTVDKVFGYFVIYKKKENV